MDYTTKTTMAIDCTIDITNGKRRYKKGTKPLVDAPKRHTQRSINSTGRSTRSAYVELSKPKRNKRFWNDKLILDMSTLTLIFVCLQLVHILGIYVQCKDGDHLFLFQALHHQGLDLTLMWVMFKPFVFSWYFMNKFKRICANKAKGKTC